MQGYNAQAVCNEQQIVIAAEVNVDSPDFGHLEPMVTAARAELARRRRRPSSPRWCSPTPATGTSDQMDAIISRGIQVLIPPDAGKRKGTRPGWDGGLYAFMRRVLETDRGGELYAQTPRR